MEALYHATNSLLEATHGGLRRAELASTTQEFQANMKELNLRIQTILSNCDRLDNLVQKEPVTKRQSSKIRVDQLKSDVKHLQSSIRNLTARHALKAQEEQNREQLLTMRFTTNAAAAAAAQCSNSDTSILIDKALEHNTALSRSHRGIDDLLQHGSIILDNLRDQRSTIKGFQKRMLDVAATLGMSSTVMRLIERRQEGDKYILIAGMVVTCIVMFLVWKYLA